MKILFNSHVVCDTKDVVNIAGMSRILDDIKKYGRHSLSYSCGWRLKK